MIEHFLTGLALGAAPGIGITLAGYILVPPRRRKGRP